MGETDCINGGGEYRVHEETRKVGGRTVQFGVEAIHNDREYGGNYTVRAKWKVHMSAQWGGRKGINERI